MHSIIFRCATHVFHQSVLPHTTALLKMLRDDHLYAHPLILWANPISCLWASWLFCNTCDLSRDIASLVALWGQATPLCFFFLHGLSGLATFFTMDSLSRYTLVLPAIGTPIVLVCFYLGPSTNSIASRIALRNRACICIELVFVLYIEFFGFW